jgi:hypothetical protein
MAAWNPRANELFASALELSSPDARHAYLDRECADAGLRRQVEALLAAHAAAGDFLDQPVPAADPGTGAYVETDAVVGTTIAGKYKLLEVIGEGGMGSVFMAQQTEPVKDYRTKP